eukprot:3581528-Prymnesium_polylepis.2
MSFSEFQIPSSSSTTRAAPSTLPTFPPPSPTPISMAIHASVRTPRAASATPRRATIRSGAALPVSRMRGARPPAHAVGARTPTTPSSLAP